MRSIEHLTGDYYHVYTRGVDKRTIFLDLIDRERFLQGLVSLNDSLRPSNIGFAKKSPNRVRRYVDILAFCLMGNHFHLLLRQKNKRGIEKFLHRLLNSYAKYFNIRHSRTGKLFEANYQSKHIQSDEQLLAVLRYIHLNPIEIIDPAWKETGFCFDKGRVLHFLREYRWSSIHDYLGLDKRPWIIRNATNDLNAKEFMSLLMSGFTDTQSQDDS